MSIYQHFRPDEHEFVDRVIRWKLETIERYSPKLTDFLDPREQEIVKTIVGNDPDVRLSLWGGSSFSERKRALLFPEYYDATQEDFQLVFYDIDYPSKFTTIEHRDVLGALMNIGVKRGKYGDILISGDRVQFVCASEISSFIELNLTKVGKSGIKLHRIEKSDLMPIETNYDERNGTVSSLRLDVVVAEIYNLSRSKASPLIQSGRVKLNHKITDQLSSEVMEGDELSVRGFGRSKLFAIEGMTKKEKWRIRYGLLK
ncbi:RNA-binding protein [Fictibacillus phosphorivorans]|uniref:YlmH family RNA-binding protein n=1 Tax=Fictibacillus phosphorivorans TaxID=1221500 RepID=UPI00203C7132|nr:RNA-binding protein [Fictibacillus phosphorivorans]MCM3717236.1 RNA-binding protein [Fictibacillus phosphorivorans]MCM3774923.1 RNA-binding protein [Fictibacillus phosphorivorans]